MAAPAEKTQVDFIIRPIIKRLNLIGFPLENLNIGTSIWWYCMTISKLVMIILICCCEATTLEDICDIVINVNLVVQGLGALLIVRIYRSVILEAVDIMQKHFWFHEDEAKHKKFYRIINSIGLGYACFCFAAASVLYVEPLYHGTGRFTIDMTFPYRNFIKESPYYGIVYFVEVVSILTSGICMACLDCLYFGVMGFVLIQIDLIKHKLKKLTSGNDGEKEMYEKLKICIAHHNVVLSSLKKIEETNKYYMLNKLLTDMACLSVTTYLFSQQLSLNMKFLSLFGVCGSQPLMYCIFGEFVTSECASIGEEAYEVSWEKFGYKSVTSALPTMIQRSQKPVYMTAGGMIMFSLPNYVAFMKMMVSFFLVLKRDQ